MTTISERLPQTLLGVAAKQTCATPPSRRSPQDRMCDGLLRQAAGPRFRFVEPNPAAAGRSYAQSLYADLPYMVGVLVRWDLHLTEAEWNCLVAEGAALDVTGSGEYRVPFTLDVVASPPDRPGRAPDEVCGECWGTGYGIDDDQTMTGVLGGLFVCFCTQASV
jgi:hypothetical protein